MAKRRAKKQITRRLEAVKPSNDAAALAARDKALRRFNEDFARELPEGGRNGYSAVDGDRFDGKSFPVPDGTYRIEGATFAFAFEGGAFIEAFVPKAPDWGGDDLVTVREFVAPGPETLPQAPAA